jgi:hypothetical protein
VCAAVKTIPLGDIGSTVVSYEFWQGNAHDKIHKPFDETGCICAKKKIRQDDEVTRVWSVFSVVRRNPQDGQRGN